MFSKTGTYQKLSPVASQSSTTLNRITAIIPSTEIMIPRIPKILPFLSFFFASTTPRIENTNPNSIDANTTKTHKTMVSYELKFKNARRASGSGMTVDRMNPAIQVVLYLSFMDQASEVFTSPFLTGLMTKQITINTGMKMMNAAMTSMIECCLMNTVDRTIRTVSRSLKMSITFFSGNARWMPAATTTAS